MREACRRVFRTRFRMPNHARDTPQPLRINFGKIGNFRKSKFSDFEILVARFEPLPFLAISCVQSLPIGATFRFLQNLSGIIGFRLSHKRETDPEDAGWPRGPPPLVFADTTSTAPPETFKIIKIHEKNSKNHQKSPKMLQNRKSSCVTLPIFRFGRSNVSCQVQ